MIATVIPIVDQRAASRVPVNLTQNGTYETERSMTRRQVEIVLAGSLINLVRQKNEN